jgi:hypothetical protein
MKTNRHFFCLLLLSCIIVFSCQKGQTGATGPQGVPGSANVQYSNWNALSMSYSNTDSLYEQTIVADSITQPILDSGIVLTYMKITNSANSQTIIVNADKYIEQLLSVGKISLYAPFDYSGYYFRYVIIPGGVPAGRLASGSRYSRAQLEAMSYEEVMKLFELK